MTTASPLRFVICDSVASNYLIKIFADSFRAVNTTADNSVAFRMRLVATKGNLGADIRPCFECAHVARDMQETVLARGQIAACESSNSGVLC